LVDLGYPVQEIGRDDARSLEPHLRLPPQPRRIFFFPNEGYVLPSLLLAGLLGQAQASGAELNRPVRVEALSSSRGGVTLHLLGGVTRHSDVTVCCAGRWTSALLATAGYDVPLVDPDAAGSPAVGYLAFTRPVGFRCQRVLTTPLLNLRPDGARRLVLQALDLDSTADPAIAPPRDGPVAEALRARLAGVMTGGELAEIDGVRVGQRVLPADGHTVAGFLDEDHHLYVVATHSGITLAPLLGRLVTAEILDEKPQPLLAPFRPGRFGRGEVVRAPASRE
jgi:glycine/D-amino acid oxidase-like deaminating enzyme